MDRLETRLQESQKASKTFLDALTIKNPTTLERDGTIQRFEYTFETVWKTAQLYLTQQESLNANSPKSVIRELGEAGILSAAETIQALAMADARNKTVHTYIEAVAVMIYSQLPEYAALLAEVVRRLSDKIGKV